MLNSPKFQTLDKTAGRGVEISLFILYIQGEVNFQINQGQFNPP